MVGLDEAEPRRAGQCRDERLQARWGAELVAGSADEGQSAVGGAEEAEVSPVEDGGDPEVEGDAPILGGDLSADEAAEGVASDGADRRRCGRWLRGGRSGGR